MKKISYILLTIFLVSLSSCVKNSMELYVDGFDENGWPHWRGVNHDSYSSDVSFKTSFEDDFEPLWITNIGMGYSAPSIQGEYLVIMGSNYDNEIVTCLDPLTGEVKWEYKYETKMQAYEGPRSTPTIDGDVVYTLSPYGLLNCLTLDKGKLVWTIDLTEALDTKLPEWNLSSSVIVEGDMLLLNIGRNGLALTKDGEIIWKSANQLPGYASPVVFDYKGKRVAAMFGASKLFIIDVEDGTEIMSYQWSTNYGVNGADPLFFDNKIFISTAYNKHCALLDISGDEAILLWENENVASHFSSSYYKDGIIYAPHGGTFDAMRGSIVSIDSKSGEIIWEYDNKMSTFIMAGNIMIALDNWGKVSFVEITDSGYSELDSINVVEAKCWTAPVFAYGILFVRNDLGDLVAINLRNP